MPSFKGSLSTQQIADVAAYVVKSTGGTFRSPRSSFRRPSRGRVAAFAVDLDRTLIAEDAVLRPRTKAAIAAARAAGVHVIVVTGRMFRSRPPVRRSRRGSTIPSSATRAPSSPTPSRASSSATCRSRCADALEVIDTVVDAGLPLNCYVDDELYVAEVTPEARALRRLPAPRDPRRRRRCATGCDADRRSSSPSATRTRSTRSRPSSSRASRAGSSSRSRCRTSSSSRTRT